MISGAVGKTYYDDFSDQDKAMQLASKFLRIAEEMERGQ